MDLPILRRDSRYIAELSFCLQNHVFFDQNDKMCADARRNYGKDNRFLNRTDGRSRLHHSVGVLLQQGVIEGNSDDMFEVAQRNTQVARMLITLGYAFDK